MGCTWIFRKHYIFTYIRYYIFSFNVFVRLSRLKVVSWTHASILGAVRVIIGPLIGFGLIKFLNLNGFAAGVLLIQSSMPSAVLTIWWVQCLVREK